MKAIANFRYEGIRSFINSPTKIVIFTALLYFLLAQLSQLLFINEINLPPIFPAMGVTVALTIIFGRKAILGTAIGSFLFAISLFKLNSLDLLSHQELINNLTFDLVRPIRATLNAFIVPLLIHLWCKTDYPFNNAKSVLCFAASCILGSMIVSSVGTFFLWLGTDFSPEKLFLLWRNYIRGNALGIIMFTPLVLSWSYKIKGAPKLLLSEKIEAFLLPIITMLLSIFVFETRANNQSLLYLVMLWTAYRFGVRLISVVALIIALVSIHYTGLKSGDFSGLDWEVNFFMLQLFLFINMVSILFFKAILDEKESEKNKLKTREQDLEIEKSILKATIESSNRISIFSLDTQLNYINFNRIHEQYMKNHYGVAINVGENHLALIPDSEKRKEYATIFYDVLTGNNFSKEEKDNEGLYWNILKSPIRNKDNKIIGVTSIITNITELKLNEIQLANNNFSLGERIKELGCLYDISKIISNKSLTNAEKLQSCVELIPNSLQFSAIAYSRIQFRDKEFLSANYKKKGIEISQKIILNGEEWGCIEMGYFDTIELKLEEAFQEEEIKLLESLTDIISKAVETKIAEEKLIKSEETYRLLFENIHDVYFKTSVKTKEILEVSPSCIAFNGITREGLIGQNMASIYADVERAQQMFQQIINEHKIIDYTNEILIKGKSYNVSINAKIIFDANGEAEYAIGSLRDVTEQKIAEESLKISEEKFRSIFESFEDVYFKKKIDGLLLDVSPSIEKYFHLKREEVIGMNAYDFYVDRDEAEHFYQAILDNNQVNDYEERFYTAKGEIIYFSVSAKVVYDQEGRPAYFEGTMRDISERIQNREKLQEVTDKIKESEEKFRTIFENMQDIYYLQNFDGKITEISPSCEKHFKFKREEMIGLYTADLYYNPSKQNELRERIIRDGYINDEHVQFKTASGEPIYFSINCKIIYDSKGMPSHIEGSIRNINERILNQKRLVEAGKKIKKSEEKFRSIFENMQDVYYLHTIDGSILDVSPSVEKHFQLNREQVIGMQVVDFYTNPAVYQDFLVQIHQNGFVNDKEIEFVTPSGQTLFFSINSKLIQDKNGALTLVEGTMRNINERILNQKKLLVAAEKIKESEKEFRSIFESFEDLYYKITLDGIIQNVSPSIKKILKYDREEIIGTSVLDLYLYEEDRNKAVETIKRTGQLKDFESIFKDKEGLLVHVSLSAHMVYDDQGVAIGSEGTIRDISQRKKSEQEIEKANAIIKESEKKYRTIFESVRDVFFRVSAIDHSVIDISPSCMYFDLTPEEIIGKSVETFYFNPADRKPVLDELAEKGEIKNRNVKLLLKSKVYDVSADSKVTFDENNNPEFIIGSFRDVTDRVQAEENLRVSELKFRSFYENLEDVYFRITMDGTILDLSPSFEKHFKQARPKPNERSVFDYYYDKEDRNRLFAKLIKDQQIIDFDARFKDYEGNIISFSINGRITTNENGEPLYIEGSMRNVNDRMQSQKETMKKNRLLEFQNTELEQFAYVASHDLQEPLITIIHCVQILQEELGEKLNDDLKQYLEFVNSSTSRMQMLVKGLLDYSRIGKERINATVDCNEIVGEVLADMKASLKESNAVVEYENLPIIEGSSTEMRQLFQNLISNANKFRKKGEQPRIKITAVKEDKNWLFSVQDNGIGIEDHNQNKVFVIFKRLNNRDEYQGTGIGLSHCKKIIEHHRGKIWVESKFNEGSTFKWTFPIEQSQI